MFPSCCSCSEVRRCATSLTNLRPSGSRGRTVLSMREPSGFRSVARGSCSSPPVPRTHASRCLGATLVNVAMPFSGNELCGFYWTEGLRGLGWADRCDPDFEGWLCSGNSFAAGHLGSSGRLHHHTRYRGCRTPAGFRRRLDRTGSRGAGCSANASVETRWKRSKRARRAVDRGTTAWSERRCAARPPRFHVALVGRAQHGDTKDVSTRWTYRPFQCRRRTRSLRDFLRFPRTPLSYRAASGFLRRADVSGLRFEEGVHRGYQAARRAHGKERCCVEQGQRRDNHHRT